MYHSNKITVHKNEYFLFVMFLIQKISSLFSKINCHSYALDWNKNKECYLNPHICFKRTNIFKEDKK